MLASNEYEFAYPASISVCLAICGLKQQLLALKLSMSVTSYRTFGPNKCKAHNASNSNSLVKIYIAWLMCTNNVMHPFDTNKYYREELLNWTWVLHITPLPSPTARSRQHHLLHEDSVGGRSRAPKGTDRDGFYARCGAGLLPEVEIRVSHWSSISSQSEAILMAKIQMVNAH